MIARQLGDRNFELESGSEGDVDNLRFLKYYDLSRCSKLVFRRCPASWVVFRLLFDALLKMLSQLPEFAIVCIPEWSSSDAFRLLHALNADWVLLDRTDLESDAPYFDVFMVSVDIPATRALFLEWESVESFAEIFLTSTSLELAIRSHKKQEKSIASS